MRNHEQAKLPEAYQEAPKESASKEIDQLEAEIKELNLETERDSKKIEKRLSALEKKIEGVESKLEKKEDYELMKRVYYLNDLLQKLKNNTLTEEDFSKDPEELEEKERQDLLDALKESRVRNARFETARNTARGEEALTFMVGNTPLGKVTLRESAFEPQASKDDILNQIYGILLKSSNLPIQDVDGKAFDFKGISKLYKPKEVINQALPFNVETSEEMNALMRKLGISLEKDGSMTGLKVNPGNGVYTLGGFDLDTTRSVEFNMDNTENEEYTIKINNTDGSVWTIKCKGLKGELIVD